MNIHIEKEESYLFVKKVFSISFVAILFFGILSVAAVEISGVIREGETEKDTLESLPVTQNNTVMPVAKPFEPLNVKKVNVVITGYSSTVWQTDSTPFITASGKWVEDGIIANNMLPFGTLVRIPELYGEKVFVVEDRMNARKGNHHFDIWFPAYEQAKNFGVKRTYLEILED
ncbi:MAG: hypothetical protein A2365_00030 [Candidatus Nealsonbacteria bacterium RIFOXYB1_FULL_40_15]|uniref:3D domain-containing protein n=2 Tax=Candidatus Nealsoniibacteriota TaxID=1817911 RepID=A0A1G2ETW9_9BACT|nr:MAG: hypothetical protein A2365_00030 [Candidatus Nealsonbacteria bacterium RIFOXYB1_FULL_40_15]OGZ28341.1 MAG: hypothetical protein A2562_00430 [Candidatus Nealsonbacteria bacterium RIFOXYD1_FULL_39_11]OGZ29147.1 MAG: hypothetical protein A2427_03595 [Candidatus Nealsonbacteria bacterium RIFOXYC1_FULL_40_7]